VNIAGGGSMSNKATNGSVIRRVLAYLFCLTLLLSEFNIFNIDISRKPPHPLKKMVSERGSGQKGVRGIVEYTGFDEEASGEMINNSIGRTSFGVMPMKYLIMKSELLLISLILWAVILVLLQDSYIERMFLMRFIHDSDGEKGNIKFVYPLCQN
jgi:hypothetical protein